LTQETFLRLLSANRTNLEAPRGFLLRTARNLALRTM
jgi:DNA-directed RNA polymerase specialized sigma24 family protein